MKTDPKSGEIESNVGETDDFGRALKVLAIQLDVVLPRDLRPTSIAVFKARYAALLNCTDDQGVSVIVRASKRYVLVSEQHLLSLLKHKESTRTVADICKALPRPKSKLTTLRIG